MLETTYDSDRHLDLPRIVWVEFADLVLRAAYSDHADEEVLWRIEQLAVACAWILRLEVDVLHHAQRENSTLDRRMIVALLIGASAVEALGGGDVAEAVVKRAEVLYKAKNGVMAGFEELRAKVHEIGGLLA